MQITFFVKSKSCKCRAGQKCGFDVPVGHVHLFGVILHFTARLRRTARCNRLLPVVYFNIALQFLKGHGIACYV